MPRPWGAWGAGEGRAVSQTRARSQPAWRSVTGTSPVCPGQEEGGPHGTETPDAHSAEGEEAGVSVPLTRAIVGQSRVSPSLLSGLHSWVRQPRPDGPTAVRPNAATLRGNTLGWRSFRLLALSQVQVRVFRALTLCSWMLLPGTPRRSRWNGRICRFVGKVYVCPESGTSHPWVRVLPQSERPAPPAPAFQLENSRDACCAAA